MSFHQSLVSSEHDFDVFALSWKAGVSSSQCLKKSLKNHDIESVNVTETCDKLRSALNENSKSHYKTSQYGGNHEKICAIPKPNIPFRAFSDIWFGTLKIYQQQVNTLFRLSQDLFSRSSYYHVKPLAASKRKSSVNSQKFAKKRRLTVCDIKEKSFFTMGYSQLLDELENLTIQKELPELSRSISDSAAQFQIREITIREISTATYLSPDIVDEDSGFGEATHEEIANFFNFIGDNSMFNVKKTNPKRKSTCEQGSPAKKSCVNDYSFELMNSENLSLDENISKTATLKRSATPIHNTFDEDKNVSLETVKIKRENAPIFENVETTKAIKVKMKKNKLIIDECIKIDVSEIMEQIKKFELSTKIRGRKTMKSYRSRRNITALELLTRFNRRSFKLSLSLKQKFYLSQQQFERDYLNLLREIFKTNYDEKFASEIYPKWKCFKDELLKPNKHQFKNKFKKRRQFFIQEEYGVNIVDEISINNVTDTNFKEYQEVQAASKDVGKLSTYIQQDWRPHGVMMKLLNLWRLNQVNEIAAAKLFKLAENQIYRALGFSTLLSLSQKQFVNLTKFPESIELQNILMGTAIESILAKNLVPY